MSPGMGIAAAWRQHEEKCLTRPMASNSHAWHEMPICSLPVKSNLPTWGQGYGNRDTKREPLGPIKYEDVGRAGVQSMKRECVCLDTQE